MPVRVKIIRNPTRESDHQANIIAWSQINREKYPDLALLHHIPNEGHRDIKEAVHLQKMGVKAGVPDLCLPVARGPYHGCYIELKTDKGRLSEAQKWWGDRLQNAGYFWAMCRGWEDAVDKLTWYLEGCKSD